MRRMIACAALLVFLSSGASAEQSLECTLLYINPVGAQPTQSRLFTKNRAEALAMREASKPNALLGSPQVVCIGSKAWK
jgi:hypothetical protein